MPKLKLPPVEWDSATVVGVRERIQISGFGIKKPLKLQAQISDHKWRFAAGDTTGKTEKQSAVAHTKARYRVWDLEMADRARHVAKNNRTDEQTDAIQKVDHPKLYQKSRKGNSCITPMIPPPATWKPELVGEERVEAWRYTAGLNDDGSAKTVDAHKHARM